MKIDRVDVGVMTYEPAIQWSASGRPQVATFVRLRLSDGQEGVSVTWNDSPSATAMALTIQAWFADALKGFDVRQHPARSRQLLKRAQWNGTSCVAVAAIDNALWDAKARVLGLPLHVVLGSVHDSLPVYAASRAELAMTEIAPVTDHVLEAKAAGYTAYKLHLWGDLKKDIAACAAVREAVGDEFELMFDPIERYDLVSAVPLARALEELGYLWLEDPIPAEHRHAYRWLAERVDIPLVAADALQWSWPDYLDVIQSKTPIALRIDAGRQGISLCKEIVDHAGASGVRCEIHAFGPEPNSVVGLHVALAQRPVSYYEACFPQKDFQIPGVIVPTALGPDGRVRAPDTAGVGTEFDWAGIDKKIEWLPEIAR